ncbi:MAG: CBS domain-containing protein, partial [Desulfomonile tiedjei]|nr:CBS domain-containing protein [Desulfomonile tiedjei]
AAVRMEDRVHLIARSSLEEVNAGEIVSEFGGGGHPTAASASIRNMSLYQVREKIIQVLKEKVRPKQKAGEIMSRPVITIAPDKTIEEAAEFLNRYQVSSLPVVRDGSVLGILHRNAVEKAIHHELNSEPVHVYMNPGVVFVTPDDPIERVLRLTVEGRHRLVPVIDGARLVGVISRSDLLEHLKLPRRSDSAGPDEYPSARVRGKSIRKLMEERLPKHVMQILRKAGEIAERRKEDIYLVGGAVRDLLLRNYNLDIDIVIEGQGIPFAKEFGAQFPGCRVRDHEKFGTAVLLFEDGFKIDVATARHEYYSSPGALPTVETSSIKRDLFRRDFTMNTLAVSLSPRTMGQVIDFFGGGRDIKERVIRVLHNLAFVEDPTRILRAVRFSSRFSFAIGKHTLALMKAAIRMQLFDKIEGKRLLNELIHMLEEKNPLSPLTLMSGLGIFQALHPALSFTNKTAELAESVNGVLSWWKYLFLKDKLDPWVVYFFSLTDSLSDDDFASVLRRFSIIGAKARQLSMEKIESRRTLALFARGVIERPSDVYQGLRNLSLESLLFMMAKTTREQTRIAVSEYINNTRYLKPLLTGKDLIAMGYAPGPVFAKILTALRSARLDGEISTVDEARRMIRSRFPLLETVVERNCC